MRDGRKLTVKESKALERAKPGFKHGEWLVQKVISGVGRGASHTYVLQRRGKDEQLSVQVNL